MNPWSRIQHLASRRSSNFAGLTIIGLSLVIGCDASTGSLESIRAAVRSQSPKQVEEVRNVGLSSDQTKGEFRPVNPNRRNPFEFPAADGEHSGPQVLLGDGSATASQVSVMGFAEVDIPRVILKVGDQTKILRAGDQVMNIKVIKISPPRVELQIDNLTWTATMFDDRK